MWIGILSYGIKKKELLAFGDGGDVNRIDNQQSLLVVHGFVES